MQATPGDSDRDPAPPQDEKRKEWLEGLRKDPVIEEAIRILDELRRSARLALTLPIVQRAPSPARQERSRAAETRARKEMSSRLPAVPSSGRKNAAISSEPTAPPR